MNESMPTKKGDPSGGTRISGIQPSRSFLEGGKEILKIYNSL